MAEEKKAAPAPQDPLDAAKARIAELLQKRDKLESEVRILGGKQGNRDPKLVDALTQENQALQAKLSKLEQALLGLLLEASQPRQSEEAHQQLDTLSRAAIEFFQKAKVDPELWKNLVS